MHDNGLPQIIGIYRYRRICPIHADMKTGQKTDEKNAWSNLEIEYFCAMCVYFLIYCSGPQCTKSALQQNKHK